MKNISNTEAVYICRAVGQMSTIHSLFPKEALDKSMHSVDIFCLFSIDSYAVSRPVEIHISNANQQSLHKALGEMSIYIQLSYRGGRAPAVPVHIVLVSINTTRCEDFGNRAAFL